MIKYSLLFFMNWVALSVMAQSQTSIVLQTKNTSLVLTVGSNHRLYQSYLGPKLATADYEKLSGGREVYLTAGMENQFEPAIRLVHADGNPSLELTYVSHTTQKKDSLTITNIVLKDSVYPVEVVLQYKVYFNEDVITCNATIQHHEKKPVRLTQYASSLLHFNADTYWLTQFHGDWAREVNMVEEKLTNGIKSIESKLGTRANFYQTPAFFLSLNNPSTETSGELIAGTLGWTGNFQFTFEVDQRNGLRVRLGH